MAISLSESLQTTASLFHNSTHRHGIHCSKQPNRCSSDRTVSHLVIALKDIITSQQFPLSAKLSGCAHMLSLPGHANLKNIEEYYKAALCHHSRFRCRNHQVGCNRGICRTMSSQMCCQWMTHIYMLAQSHKLEAGAYDHATAYLLDNEG